ncbi:MAG: hypothetical protein ACK456_02290 [Pseudanabaenaceae cyanobacterium]|jgi:hypothetical protein
MNHSTIESRSRCLRRGITTSLLLVASLAIGSGLEQTFAPLPANALTCKKGKPCGKACIPQNSVCQLSNSTTGSSGSRSTSTTVFPVSSTPISSPKPLVNYRTDITRTSSSNCQLFPRQGTNAPVGASFSDSLGRTVVLRNREEIKGGISKVTLAYQGNNNEFLHIRYNRQDWGKYLSGETNQAKYRVSGEVKPTKWREQVEKDCNGRSSYTATLIRQLGY